jgi:rare lipoprotein A
MKESSFIIRLFVLSMLGFVVSIGHLSGQVASSAGTTTGTSVGIHSLPLPQLRGEPGSRAQRAVAQAVDALEDSRSAEVPTPRLPLPSIETAATDTPTSTPITRDEDLGIDLEGLASWYGGKFQGRQTANGEVFDTNELTAAHRTLPFGTLVRVHNPQNSSSVVVRINDRGPFVGNRIIDLSRAGADAIGMTGDGVALVRLEVMYVPSNHQFHTIQVASFGSRSSAMRLRDKLREAGLEAAIESPAEPAVHRVVIQGVLLDDIDNLRADLTQLGYANVLVRRR